VFFVVVLGAVTVGELDQAIVVRQAGVRFPKTPSTDVVERKSRIKDHIVNYVVVENSSSV